MVVVCGYCERESRDDEFCDYCNREIAVLRERTDAPFEFELASGLTIPCYEWARRWPTDPLSSLHVQVDERSFRVYGFSEVQWAGWQSRVDARKATRITVLPEIEIIPVTTGTVVVVESHPQDVDVTDLLKSRAKDDEWIEALSQLLRLCAPFVEVMNALHAADLVWLNFAPEALVRREGACQVSNLDLAVFRIGESPAQLSVSPRFSPPEVCRFRAEKIGPAADVYHLAMLCYYWLADLPDGFPGRGLDAFQHRVPALRIYRPSLPPGIAPVIERALSYEPEDRFETVQQFVDALTEAVDSVNLRYHSALEPPKTSSTPSWFRRLLPWCFIFCEQETEFGDRDNVELWGESITGRAKDAVGVKNQDGIEFGKCHPRTERSGLGAAAFGIVADGVTNAKAGSGERASAITCRVLSETLGDGGWDCDTDAEFEKKLTNAARSATEQIVQDAMSQPELPSGLNDSDLMSSTAVVAAIQGRRLRVGNLGDSRAYLVTEDFIEQLTVDGDVASTQLAARVAPENIAELGLNGKALQFCVGAACTDEQDGFVSEVTRTTPQFGHWPLQSGDIVLLCSDGLIDEGVFLHPREAKEIIDQLRQEPAQAIVEKLVEAANSMQREPSASEPQGFGDNIACVVMKCDFDNYKFSKEPT